MKTSFKFALLLFFIVTFNNLIFGQITDDDVASWGLKILSSELNNQGKYDGANAVLGLAKLFERSSERKYQTNLAQVMASMNLSNGVYAINSGNIALVPDGYIKENGEWYSLNDIKDGELAIIGNGKLLSVPKELIIFYKDNNWRILNVSNIKPKQGFMYKNGGLEKLNDGWYYQNSEWKHISNLIQKQNENRYKYYSDEPYGLYSYSDWSDVDNDGVKDKSELSGFNKETYNIAKEHLVMALNVPVISDKVVFTSWRNGKIIGSTLLDMKKRGSSYARQVGLGGNPSMMDYMDRILLDVRKNGPGNYKIIAINSDTEFEYFEKTVRVVYEP